MCLIVFSYQQHSRYNLIFAANRDEKHDRPSRKARFWDKNPNLLAGKDLQSGGTWMGVTKSGAFSAITNFRDPEIQKENPPSRGHLVLDYLTSGEDPVDYLNKVDKKADEYMGFNLLTGTPQKLAYYSNQQKNVRVLNSGLYGLSNHLLDTPWPKVERAKNELRQIIKQETISEEALFKLLANEQKAPDERLPNTGIPKDIEKQVSPVFIKGEEYGTRCSTVLLINKEGEVTFNERRYKAGTQELEEKNSCQFVLHQSGYSQ